MMKYRSLLLKVKVNIYTRLYDRPHAAAELMTYGTYAPGLKTGPTILHTHVIVWCLPRCLLGVGCERKKISCGISDGAFLEVD